MSWGYYNGNWLGFWKFFSKIHLFWICVFQVSFFFFSNCSRFGHFWRVEIKKFASGKDWIEGFWRKPYCHDCAHMSSGGVGIKKDCWSFVAWMSVVIFHTSMWRGFSVWWAPCLQHVDRQLYSADHPWYSPSLHKPSLCRVLLAHSYWSRTVIIRRGDGRAATGVRPTAAQITIYTIY